MIILGTVSQVLPSRWTTADGQRPANPHDRANQETIFTPVVVQVDRYLKGTQAERQLLLSAFGGVVGRDSVSESDGVMLFGQGERVVLFLRERTRQPQILDGRPLWDVVNHYTITQEGEATFFFRHVPLQQLLDEIAEAQRRQ